MHNGISTRPDTRQNGRGQFGRGRNTAQFKKICYFDKAWCRVACPRLKISSCQGYHANGWHTAPEPQGHSASIKSKDKNIARSLAARWHRYHDEILNHCK